MVVGENGLLFHGVLYAVLGLVRGLFRLEVYQTAGVLPVFEDMNDGVRRPFALIAGVVAAGAACPCLLYTSTDIAKSLCPQAAHVPPAVIDDPRHEA